jgi:Ice-binding-like/PEP-CTERM motif
MCSWQVGSSATLGTTTAFNGNILALTSITLNTGASIGCGSALARNGAVTLDNNVIGGGCGGTSTVPEPGTMSLMGSGLVMLAGAACRKMRSQCRSGTRSRIKVTDCPQRLKPRPFKTVDSFRHAPRS